MSETFVSKTEQLPPNQAIAGVIHGWLLAEIENSGKGANAVLDDFDESQRALQLPYVDPANFMARKSDGHYDRLQLWTDTFEQDSYGDQSTSHQLFGVLAGLSGAFRTQCVVLAQHQQGYTHRRANEGPLGIDIKERVDNRLQQRFGRLPSSEKLAQEVIYLDDLVDSTHRVNSQRNEVMRGLLGKEPTSMRKLVTTMRLLKLQGAWLDLGVDYMLYAAQVRAGDLGRVPLLEPKSITDAEIFYPFTEQQTGEVEATEEVAA